MDSLKLGKGAAFVKSQLLRVSQEDGVWEAEFYAVPCDDGDHIHGFFGLVVGQDGSVLREEIIETRPTVNDLAILLAHAMRSPFVGSRHRPTSLVLRDRPEWAELLPHLGQIGVKVTLKKKLRKSDRISKEVLADLHQEIHKHGQVVESMFPSIASFVKNYGWIEIGDQETFGFIARALDHGGLIHETKEPQSLDEAMNALEAVLEEHLKERTRPAKGTRRRG